MCSVQCTGGERGCSPCTGGERGCSPCRVLLDLQAEASGALERNTGISRALSGPIPPFHFFSYLCLVGAIKLTFTLRALLCRWLRGGMSR